MTSSCMRRTFNLSIPIKGLNGRPSIKINQLLTNSDFLYDTVRSPLLNPASSPAILTV